MYTREAISYLPFAVHVAQQEDAEDDGHHVPLREDEAGTKVSFRDCARSNRKFSYLNVCAMSSCGSRKRECKALNRTSAGICSRHTCKA